VISIIAEVRSLFYRENPGAKFTSMHAATLGPKAASNTELLRTADIYLRSSNLSDLHGMLVE